MTKLFLRFVDCRHSRVQYIRVFVISNMINCTSVVKLRGKPYIADLETQNFNDTKFIEKFRNQEVQYRK